MTADQVRLKHYKKAAGEPSTGMEGGRRGRGEGLGEEVEVEAVLEDEEDLKQAYMCSRKETAELSKWNLGHLLSM